MIGGILDSDMQYLEVNEKLVAHRREHLHKEILFLPILE